MDSRLPHLARAFTYTVPTRLARRVRPGVRVRVRLAGQLTEGYVLGPGAYDGAATAIESVVSDWAVLAAPVLRLCEQVAQHCIGSVPDVLRLAVPARVASAEADYGQPTKPKPAQHEVSADGSSLGARIVAGEQVRACLDLPAGASWPHAVAQILAPVLAAGRGVLVVVPDRRDLARLQPAVAPWDPAVLSAELPPRERYGQFLRVLGGDALLAVGTRAAVFAPVSHLSLVIVWDDGDESLAEQRAPYPHARDVAALRSATEPCSVLFLGHARSPEVQRWVDSEWLTDESTPGELRACRPAAFSTADRVRSPFDVARRLPQSAVAALRTGLAQGPVLVQVARTGYIPLTACQQCREWAQCPECAGPLALAETTRATCRRCGYTGTFHCPECDSTRLRAVRSGAGRTAEELGRMFPGVPVVQSTGDHPVASVPAQCSIVVATPGVEPQATTGYAAGALLDAQEDLWRVGVKARQEAARRWFNAAALLRPGAPLAVAADSTDPAVAALLRWDPSGAARDDLERRTAAALPPSRTCIQLDGTPADVHAVLAQLGDSVEVLGPREVSGSSVRALVRAQVPQGYPEVRELLRATIVGRAARHAGVVRVQVDPVGLD